MWKKNAGITTRFQTTVLIKYKYVFYNKSLYSFYVIEITNQITVIIKKIIETNIFQSIIFNFDRKYFEL